MGKTALSQFYNGAFRLAIETQTPIKPLLFLDAYDRMHYDTVFSMNPGISRAIYLDEIPVTGLTLDDVETLKEQVYRTMENHLHQLKATWIRP